MYTITQRANCGHYIQTVKPELPKFNVEMEELRIEVLNRQQRLDEALGLLKRMRSSIMNDLLDVEYYWGEIEDLLNKNRVEFCIAEDVGADECRCEECIEGFAAQADYYRKAEREES